MMKFFPTLGTKRRLERLKRSVGSSKSSALLLTILVVGLIAIVSLSVSRLSISEIKMAGGANESAAAYFAAEAGLEDGLARWRWNRNIEVPTGATETSTEVLRCNISTNQCDEPSNLTINSDDKYYDLKIWYKKDTVGNFTNVSDPNNPTLAKDDVLEFNSEGMTNFTIKYVFTDNASLPLGEAIQHGIEVIQVNADGTILTREFKNQEQDAAASSGISFPVAAGGKIVRIKPWLRDSAGYIRYTIKPNSGAKIDSGTHYIESTGYYKNTKRKLVAKIDRKSGTILSVYDFVIYAGSTLTNQ